MQGKGLHLMHGRGQRQDKKGRETSRSQRRLAVMETASAQWQHGYQLAARAAHEASDLAALEGARRMHRPRGALLARRVRSIMEQGRRPGRGALYGVPVLPGRRLPDGNRLRALIDSH